MRAAAYERRVREYEQLVARAVQGEDPASRPLAIPASAKANALLQERLGPTRWRLFQETGTLMEPSRLWPATVTYRAKRREPVLVFHEARHVASLCVMTRAGEPEADRLLTILDLIQADERRLWEMGTMQYLSAMDHPAGDRLRAEATGAAPPKRLWFLWSLVLFTWVAVAIIFAVRVWLG